MNCDNEWVHSELTMAAVAGLRAMADGAWRQMLRALDGIGYQRQTDQRDIGLGKILPADGSPLQHSD